METSNILSSILRMRGIEVIEKENHLWFASPEYVREIRFNRPLRALRGQESNFFHPTTWLLI